MAHDEYTLILAEAGSSVPADGSVTTAKLANYSAYSIVGRNSGSSGAPSSQTCTSFGFSFLTSANASAALTTLGLSFPLGTSSIDDAAITLAKQANLAAYSVIGRNNVASGVPIAEPCTAYGFSLIAAANAAAARTLLGVSFPVTVANGGTGATSLSGIVVGNGTSAFSTVSAPSGTIVGHTDTQTLTNKTINGSSNTITNVSLTTGVTGTLPEANGGTGKTDLFGGTNTWSATNTFNGDVALGKTITAAATTGAQTINKNAGSVNFAAAATSLVVTNSRVTTSSVIIATVATNDATMKAVQAVAASGSFTLYADAAATAETRVNWIVIN